MRLGRPEDYGWTRRDYRLLAAALPSRASGRPGGPPVVWARHRYRLRVRDGVVQALVRFDDVGKIQRGRCGPLSGET